MVTPELMAAWEKRGTLPSTGGPIAGADELQRIAATSPDTIAPLVVYLATDQTANINGCTFLVSGGQISLYSEPALLKTIYTKEEMWSLDDLMEIMPRTIEEGLVNPSPPKE